MLGRNGLEPPIARTANGIATTAKADPATETTSHASRSWKLRLRSGPEGIFIGAILPGGAGAAGGRRAGDADAADEGG
jgi:hypothetical protein